MGVEIIKTIMSKKMQSATVFQVGGDINITAGKMGVQSVFASSNNNEQGTLVVVYEDKIVKYVGIPFVVTSPRAEKTIEA